MFTEQFVDQLAQKIADLVVEKLSAKTEPQNRLMTVEQAAEYIGRSKQAVYILINQGKIPAKRQGSRVFLDRKALDQWIDELSD